MILYLTIYSLFCVLFARVNAGWIKQGLKINHTINGVIHLLFALAAGIYFEWYHFLTVLLVGRVVFDISLNLFRGLGLDYVSPNPTSKVDIIEKKIFGNKGILPKLIYIALATILIIV